MALSSLFIVNNVVLCLPNLPLVSSHLICVPVGVTLADVLVSSPIIAEDGVAPMGIGGGGGGKSPTLYAYNRFVGYCGLTGACKN